MCAGLCWAGLVPEHEAGAVEGGGSATGHVFSCRARPFLQLTLGTVSETTGNRETCDRWPWNTQAIEGYFYFGISCNETLIPLPLNLHDRSSE